MILLIESDKFFEERITLAVGTGCVFHRKRTKAHVELSHLVNDIAILDIESLNLYRKRIMVGTLASLELRRHINIGTFGRIDCASVFASNIGIIGHVDWSFLTVKVTQSHNLIDCFLHLRNLCMSKVRQSELHVLADLVLDELCILFRVTRKIAVHDLIVGELQKEDCALVVISFFGRSVKPSLNFLSKFNIHIYM